MSESNYYCPVCGTRVLFSPTRTVPEAQPPRPGENLYCPSCEMLVQPIDYSVRQPASDPQQNPGRNDAGGSNAGGSQRGDLSDQGATLWRSDPAETERNTWSDKD